MPEKRKRDEPKQKRKPKGKRQFPVDANDVPCHLCGGTEFEWGRLHQTLYLKPSALTIFGGKDVYARLCLSCGNIQAHLRSDK